MAPVLTAQVGSTWARPELVGVVLYGPIVTVDSVELQPAAFCSETVCVEPGSKTCVATAG